MNLAAKHWLTGLAVAALGIAPFAVAAHAEPILQLYSPGGTQGDTSTYSNSEESWVDKGTTGFQLWVAGDATGNMNGTDGVLHNVTVVAAYNTSLGAPLGAMTIGNAANPLAMGYTNSWNGVVLATTGPSANGATVNDPNFPGNLSVGSAFNNHSVVTSVNPTVTGAFAGVAGRRWISFNLGNMSDLTHCVTDFTGSQADVIGNPCADTAGEIFALDIGGLGGQAPGTVIDFGVYAELWSSNPSNHNHTNVYQGESCTQNGNGTFDCRLDVNNPASHSLRWEEIGTVLVPEPASGSMLGSWLATLGMAGWYRRRRDA